MPLVLVVMRVWRKCGEGGVKQVMLVWKEMEERVCLWKWRDGVQKEQTEYNGSCEGRDSGSGERG